MSNSHKLLLTAAIFVLLVGSPFLQSATVNRSNAQTTTASCPANQTLRMTLFGGAPNSYNMLSAAIYSAFIPSLWMYPGVNGVITPDGSNDLNQSSSNVVASNSNYTVWQFHIVPGLKWSDGTNVSTGDILRTYSSSFALNASIDFLGLHTEIAKEFAVNSSTVEFDLNKSDPWFPTKASTPLYTDLFPQSFTSQGASYNGYGSNLVVLGPYAVQAYTGATQALFLRNQYFEPTPKACAISINFVESDSADATALAGGQTDLTPVEPSNVAQLTSNSNIHVIDQKQMAEEEMIWNVSSYPYNMTAFRQAMAYAINESAIVQKAFVGYSTAAYASEGETPSVSKYYDSNQVAYSYNTQKAISLLSSIGITQKNGQMTYPNGSAITLNMFYQPEFVDNTNAANLIQQQLQSLGFTINLNPLTTGNAIGDSFTGNQGFYDSMWLGLTVGPMFGSPYTQTQPACTGNVEPINCEPSWEGPVGSLAEKQYRANESALDSTADPALVTKYYNNIQELNAINLPDLPISYPDSLWGYSTQLFTNWPTNLMLTSSNINNSALAQITPLASTSTTSSNSGAPTNTTSSTPASSTTASGTPTTQTTQQTTSTSAAASSSSGGGGGLTELSFSAVAMAAVVIIVAGASLYIRSSAGKGYGRRGG